MSKSIKLSDNTYLDSSSITHDRTTLKTILNGQPKLLWTGDFSSGSITVPNANKYLIFIMQVGYFICIGNRFYGRGGGVQYYGYNFEERGYRLTATSSGDDIVFSINSENKGGTNGTSNEPIQIIWGLF